MAEDPPTPAPAPPPAPPAPARGERFYDTAFSIEAMQREPYQNGFTWRTVLGAFFIGFVMLPGIIFMGLMIGQDLGTAAEWVTIILFVEVARRAFVTLRKQELYILKYTASQLSHISGGMALGGGLFAQLVWNRYARHSEAFASFGITEQVPDWISPYGEAAFRGFLSEAWLPVVAVMVAAALLSKLTQLSLGFLVYKAVADMEKLPFPMAPIHAEGAIALAESSQDTRQRGWRQSAFSVGVVGGALFGVVYLAVPTLSSALLGRPLELLPIPFLDLTPYTERLLPASPMAVSLNLALVVVGFVMPWRVVVGLFTAAVLMNLVGNPLLQRAGLLPTWSPGKDAIETQVSNHLDLYLSVGIGTTLAIALTGFWSVGRMVRQALRAAASGNNAGGLELSALWRRDRERGDPPLWVPVGVWLLASVGFVVLSHHLINGGLPPEERFSPWWLAGFAFLFTPLNTYINARLSAIAGQHAGIPYIAEAAIFTSGHRGVSIWFSPLPIHNYGTMSDLLRETQLTRTRFTSLLKAELLIFPLMLVASFLFWSYISGLGPIPSENYPYVQKFWPQFAQMKALWASSMQEGNNLLLQALRPEVITVALVGASALFGGFGILGWSSQYLYGGIGALLAMPQNALLLFTGAVLGRYVLARRFGKELWTNTTPILAVGFMAGMGLVGMFSIAVNFLWTAIGQAY